MMDSRSTEFGGSQFCMSDCKAYTMVSSFVCAPTPRGGRRTRSERTRSETTRSVPERRPMIASIRRNACVVEALPKKLSHDGRKEGRCQMLRRPRPASAWTPGSRRAPREPCGDPADQPPDVLARFGAPLQLDHDRRETLVRDRGASAVCREERQH